MIPARGKFKFFTRAVLCRQRFVAGMISADLCCILLALFIDLGLPSCHTFANKYALTYVGFVVSFSPQFPVGDLA